MENFDISEFAKMFDAALASDNPAVKKALRNFMMVAAIVHTQELNEDERLAGPFETLLKKIENLERMVYEARNRNSNYKDYQINTTPWVTTYPSGTSAGTTSIADVVSVSRATTRDDINELLKDLKFK